MDVQYQTNRATTTTRAISTLGECPKWDAAVQDFLRSQALAQSAEKFGLLQRASEASDVAQGEVEAKFGRNWKANDEAKAILAPFRAALLKAEEDMAERYYRPLWAAQRRLALTTPPSLNAALFKAELIESEEIWNDTQLGRDAFEIVADDMARFAGEAA